MVVAVDAVVVVDGIVEVVDGVVDGVVDAPHAPSRHALQSSAVAAGHARIIPPVRSMVFAV
jgi:hypothetical protein